MIVSVNLILIVFIAIAAVAATRVRELVSAVFILSAYSFFLSVLWALLGAVDVSFTEAVVGAGASTIFFLLALFRAEHFVKPERFHAPQINCLVLVLILGGLFVWASLDLPWLGSLTSAPSTHISPYYLLHSLQDSHTPNVVTAVVVDYRGFDTLMETVVIFTAGIACLLIMRVRP